MNWGCALIGILFFQTNLPFIACIEFPNDAPNDDMHFHAAGDFDLEPSDFASNHRQLLSYFELPVGKVETLAGSGVSKENTFSDGIGTAASFLLPFGLALSSDGNTLFVSDKNNHCIRTIDTATTVVRTLAGYGSPAFEDGIGTHAGFYYPHGLAVSCDETDLYVAGSDNNCIRVIDLATAAVTTLVGSGYADSTDGIGSNAAFKYPMGVALSSGDGATLFVSEFGAHRIRVVDTVTATTKTLAGSGAEVSLNSGTTVPIDGIGTNAAFKYPSGIAVNSMEGLLFVADTANNCIRVVHTDTAVVETLAGSGSDRTVDGTGTGASFRWPRGLALSSDGGVLYVADQNSHRIRIVDIGSTVVTTLAGQFRGPFSIALSLDDSTLFAGTANHRIRVVGTGILTPVSHVPCVPSPAPTVIPTSQYAHIVTVLMTMDATAPPSEDDRLTLHSNITHNLDGLEEPYNLDISERSFRLTLSDDLPTRRKLIGTKKSNGKELDSGHRRSLLEGSVSWQLDLVLVVIVDPENEVDLYALILGAISNSCMVCTSGDDDGRAANIECVPSLTRCYDITVEVNTRRPSLSPTYAATAELKQGVVVTLAGSGEPGASDGIGTSTEFYYPFHLAISSDGSVVYVADKNNHRIRMIDTESSLVSTLAGSSEGFADGIGTSAKFDYPHGVAVSRDGAIVYVGDADTYRVREINTATAAVTTLAGSGLNKHADGIGTGASFRYPHGVTESIDGSTLYIAEFGFHSVRIIDLSTALVTTLAGNGLAGDADGTGTFASFYYPHGIAVTSDGGTLYMGDTMNHIIRAIDTATSAVTTLAGSGTGIFEDGVGTYASFKYPRDVAVSSDGATVYVADQRNHRIRAIDTATLVVATLAGSGSNAFADGIGASASFQSPFGVAVTQDGSLLYICDYYNNLIRIVGTGILYRNELASRRSLRESLQEKQLDE